MLLNVEHTVSGNNCGAPEMQNNFLFCSIYVIALFPITIVVAFNLFALFFIKITHCIASLLFLFSMSIESNQEKKDNFYQKRSKDIKSGNFTGSKQKKNQQLFCILCAPVSFSWAKQDNVLIM